MPWYEKKRKHRRADRYHYSGRAVDLHLVYATNKLLYILLKKRTYQQSVDKPGVIGKTIGYFFIGKDTDCGLK
jgi:hypothetical protein